MLHKKMVVQPCCQQLASTNMCTCSSKLASGLVSEAPNLKDAARRVCGAYRAVIDDELFKKDTSVVEITFEGDAAVVAWLLPRRHNTSTDGMCLAVLGKEKSVLDVAGVVYSKTFLHHPTPISYTLLDASSKALLRYWEGLGLGLE
jgi:hypothetical protein